MWTCGIDVGSRTIKVVLAEHGRVVGKSIRVAGLELEKDVEATLTEALHKSGISREQVGAFVATGAGREAVGFAQHRPTVITCAARGIHEIAPGARMVIDVGAEEGRAIQCEGGKVQNFVINEKCAAGAGTFIETMARTLEVTVDSFGPLALRSQGVIAMNAQCAVFAESEVVSLIHQKATKEDIARAVCDAMAGRIGSMSRRISITPPVALIGGVAHNRGFIHSLESDLKVDLVLPPDPEFVSAVGAAALAGEEV